MKHKNLLKVKNKITLFHIKVSLKYIQDKVSPKLNSIYLLKDKNISIVWGGPMGFIDRIQCKMRLGYSSEVQDWLNLVKGLLKELRFKRLDMETLNDHTLLVKLQMGSTAMEFLSAISFKVKEKWHAN